MKLKSLMLFGFVVVALSAATSLHGQTPGETPRRVLFVGNSFTFYSDGLHNRVGDFLRASGTYAERGVRLRALTLSGGRLAELAGGIASVVEPGLWDLVVMHGHSAAMESPESAADFAEAARVISRFVRENGAEPAFLMTWPYRNRPQMLGNLEQGYGEAGRLLKAKVIPVGIAFARVNREYPEIELYQPDLLRYEGEVPVYEDDIKHPSTAGTYLAAAVVVAAIFEESPVNSPYHADLPADTASILQRVAWETVQAYR